MERVESSNIYGIEKQGDDLLVEFNSGKCYIYFDAAQHFELMLDCDSPGKYFNSEVKVSYEWKEIE